MATFLLNAINTTMTFIGDAPVDTFVTPPNNEGWMTATLSWSNTKFFKFEVLINADEGQTLACVLEREGLTYPWGEKFMTALYNVIDGRPPDMPHLEDVVDIYADMPPLEGHN